MKRLVAVLALALVAGCFNPEKPTCSYACADSAPPCPNDYECRNDGYCHLVGTTDVCPFPQLDMSVVVTSDMSMRDLASSTPSD